MGALIEPLIHGAGNDEDAWALSSWLRQAPQLDYEALTHGSPRVVVVAPHPDDEVLGCGGLIWETANRGASVLVVSATQGEACFQNTDTAEIAAIRARELVEALRALGVPSAAIRPLGLPDGGLATHEGELRAMLSDLLRPSDFVLATWEHDGHPDHEALGRATRAAALRRGARFATYPIWAWHWLAPENAPDRLSGAVRFSLTPEARSAKHAATQAFISQLSGMGAHPPILPPGVLARFHRAFEVFLP